MPLNEDGINKEPLRAHLAKGSRDLVNSYINYGRPYTVEANVKVFYLFISPAAALLDTFGLRLPFNLLKTCYN